MRFNNALPQRDTLGEQILNILRLKIVSGQYNPGTRLSENQIANEFNTSRSPVREAFKILATEGLIRLERMGAVVLGLDSEDLKELYEVRYLIESYVLKRLAYNGNSNIINTLESITDKMELADKHRNSEEFAHLDFLFHDTIINGINHNRISHLWKNIKHIVLAVLLITTEKRFEFKKVEINPLIERHRMVMVALRSGSEGEIERITEEHFKDSINSIDKLL
jgi:GntR family transcriptional regulator of gluconate operon